MLQIHIISWFLLISPKIDPGHGLLVPPARRFSSLTWSVIVSAGCRPCCETSAGSSSGGVTKALPSCRGSSPNMTCSDLQCFNWNWVVHISSGIDCTMLECEVCDIRSTTICQNSKFHEASLRWFQQKQQFPPLSSDFLKGETAWATPLLSSLGDDSLPKCFMLGSICHDLPSWLWELSALVWGKCS